jgi:indole-3-acetate monooxygenase
LCEWQTRAFRVSDCQRWIWNAHRKVRFNKTAGNRLAQSERAPKPDSEESASRALAAARELGPKIQAAADEIEQGRRLPLHLVEEMQRAGMFRMAMPKAWGGPELDFLSQMRVIEQLSIADASAGWCAMIGVDGGYMTAYIDQTVAREM